MPAPNFQEYYSDYAKVASNSAALSVIAYQHSPCYLIPRVHSGSARLQRKDTYYHLLSDSTPTAGVIPFDIPNPKVYLQTLIETIHTIGGVTNVPHSYAMALTKMGYKAAKRPWGNQDFVFETSLLNTLPGKRHSRVRTYINKLKRDGVHVRELGSGDREVVKDMCHYWHTHHSGRTGRMNYATDFVTFMDAYPESMRVKCIGLFDKADQIIGVAIAALLTDYSWSCSFRYANNSWPSASMMLFHEISKHYTDLPYEVDGDAGGADLYEFKRRLLTDPVLDKQIFMYTVKR